MKVDGLVFPHTDKTTKKTTLAKYRAAKKHRTKLRKSVRLAGNGPKKPETQKGYLGSQLVRFASLVDAAKKLEYHERLSLPEYEAMASSLAMHKPIAENVFYYLKSKGNGKYRCICDFGVQHRAAQSIVSDLIAAQFKPAAFQHNVPGRSVQLAVRRTKKFYEKGYVHALRLDVKAYYDHFNHAALMGSKLLPKAVTENVMIGRNYTMVPKGGLTPYLLSLDYPSILHSGGIPQGSACSPLVGNFYVSKLKYVLPKGTAVLNYADDFLVMAKSVEKLEKAKNALQASVEALSVGQFELLVKTGSSFTSGFEFLGHSFEMKSGGGLAVTISLANQQKIVVHWAKTFEEIEDLFHKQKKTPLLKGQCSTDR